jgi:hypothetical protein
MILKQECFKTIKDFDKLPKHRKGNGEPGVYLWGFSLEKQDFTIPSKKEMFFPYYVGKIEGETGCMYQRAHEHISSLCGGNYSIFNILNCVIAGTLIGNVQEAYQGVSKAAKKTRSIAPTLPNPSFPDLLHFPEGVHRHYQFFTDKMITSQIDWMIKHFCITFLALQNYNKKDIADLEKYVGSIVGYEKLITKRYLKPNIHVQIVDTPQNVNVESYDDLFKHCRWKMTGVKFGI